MNSTSRLLPHLRRPVLKAGGAVGRQLAVRQSGAAEPGCPLYRSIQAELELLVTRDAEFQATPFLARHIRDCPICGQHVSGGKQLRLRLRGAVLSVRTELSNRSKALRPIGCP